ncbi:hypothetical protein UCRPC4_g06055 [Phaeomoniella chlamydospora]|uniref:Uncharacterized protein n=1 Tax=Phaeomoniella chlamydospora TaxID=158046 RepID=A0A0G2DZ99_PHACM|nr:hypothetical protein UCRPC4_g06055 [Phaeomoniella chlamydospora]
MGNCFSSEKGQTSQATPNVPKEKSTALPTIEKTDGKLSTSSIGSSAAKTVEKPRSSRNTKDDVPAETTDEADPIAVAKTLEPAPERIDSGKGLASEESKEQKIETVTEEAKPTVQKTEPVAASSAETTAEVTATETTSPTKSTAPLSPIITDLPASTEKEQAQILTATASPSSLKTPGTTLQPASTKQTTPPTSAISPPDTEKDAADATIEPRTSTTVPITPMNTVVTSPSPTTSNPPVSEATQTNKSELQARPSKRTSRLSRMFSKKDKSALARTTSTSIPQSAVTPAPITEIVEEPASSRPSSKKQNRPSPLVTRNSSRLSSSHSQTGSTTAGEPPASPSSLVSPTVEGRRYNQDGDNDSLFCY